MFSPLGSFPECQERTIIVERQLLLNFQTFFSTIKNNSTDKYSNNNAFFFKRYLDSQLFSSEAYYNYGILNVRNGHAIANSQQRTN